MKKTLFTVALFTVFLSTAVFAQGNGWMSRYWDGCKQSCSWPNNAGAAGTCKACNRDDSHIANPQNGASSCDGGPQYTCWDMAPWVDASNPNLAYGFVATGPPNQCGTCIEITFTGEGEHGTNSQHRALVGKRMIVMAANIGHDVAGNQYDLMVPGGGLGQFDAFSSQIGVQASQLGARYGGLLSTCEGEVQYNASRYQECLRGKCASVFAGTGRREWLKAGCDFYANWMMAAGNPRYTSRRVDCPAVLTDRYRNQATGTPGGGGPPPQTFTLTTARNPAAGGTTTPASTQAGILNGDNVNISATPASGYTFSHWTMTGTGTINNANSASTSVAVRGNVTVTANFNSSATPTTYTLTINRNPTTVTGSTINVSGTAYTAPRAVNANTAIPLTATVPAGFRFVNWTVTGTGATIANATSATAATVTLTGNATITANFAATYTLTVNRNPTAGGTVTQSAQTNIAAGTAVNISATAAQGYTFTNWTITGTGGTIANANSASTSVTVNGNVTVTANFQATGTTPTNYTLTINRAPMAGGTVTPASGTSYLAGTPVTISATAATGYTFVNWTVTGTGATIANANSASTSVTLTGNATITANFQQNSVTTTMYTLTINRSPTTGGNVTPESGGRHNAGTPISISATTNSGYMFTSWTVTGTGATIANANSAATTVTLTGNATITANFQQQVTQTCNNGVTLTRNVVPAGSGSVNVTPSKNCYDQGEDITVAAVANAGFEFVRWEGDGTWDGAPADLGATSMWWHRTLTAYFRATGSGGIVDPPIVVPGERGEITKIEAEDYDGNVGNFEISPPNDDDVVCIGYIENGHRASYNISPAKAGAATLQFMVATGIANSAFTVWVNNAQVGRIEVANTGSWDTYQLVTLTGDANLNAGRNTIELRFESAVNVDYFLILTEPGTMSAAPVSVRHSVANAGKNALAGVTLKAGVKGFSATLPAGHAYTSYKLVDPRGRVLRRGNIGTNVTGLRFDNLNSSGVVFLRLESRNSAPMVIRTVTY